MKNDGSILSVFLLAFYITLVVELLVMVSNNVHDIILKPLVMGIILGVFVVYPIVKNS